MHWTWCGKITFILKCRLNNKHWIPLQVDIRHNGEWTVIKYVLLFSSKTSRIAKTTDKREKWWSLEYIDAYTYYGIRICSLYNVVRFLFFCFLFDLPHALSSPRTKTNAYETFKYQLPLILNVQTLTLLLIHSRFQFMFSCLYAFVLWFYRLPSAHTSKQVLRTPRCWIHMPVSNTHMWTSTRVVIYGRM